jgi:RHS repeat-associated protein
MKWTRFFLLLFLVPNLIYASSYYLKEYKKDVDKISAEWKRHDELVQQFVRLSLDEKGQNINLVNESIACCHRAIGHCDHILKKIGKKSKEDRKEWKDKKNQAEKDKDTLHTEISNLQALINNTFKDIAFSKAIPLYQESEKKANLASLKNQSCARRLNNVEEVSSTLNETGKLYEEALSLARDALNLISPYPDEESKNVLRQAIENYQTAANKYRKEAADWPAYVLAQKATLKERLATLKEDKRLFEEKGLKRSSYEVEKQTVPILEQLIESSPGDEGEIFKEELSQLKKGILAFETEADSNRLTEITSLLSQEDFRNRETERRELFFKSNLLLDPELFLQNILQPRPCALPLDGHVAKKDSNFTLYTEQFYRFLVQSDSPVSRLLVKVYSQGQVIHEENIAILARSTPAWERFLIKDGMVFIPETKLKAEFGLDLRLSFVHDPKCNFSMIIAQKGTHPSYQFSISLDEGNPLYTFSLSIPPPWQLGVLRKPALPNADRPIGKTSFSGNLSLLNESDRQLALSEPISYPVLDQLIDELKKDPLIIASYVYHEIAFVDPFVYQENGVFYAPGIHRNALRTYLEKKGSPWEQCQLLTYLLRKAGYSTFYEVDGVSSLPKTFVEKLLLTKLPEDQKEAFVRYPWVVFFDGKEWIRLFPWMKEMQIEEGHDLYSLMPDEYSSADRWILRYLKGDEKILKWIEPDKDDTAGVLFVRFVKEQLRQQGLSLSDVGTHRLQLKKQFSSWRDFPRPSTCTDANLLISPNTQPGAFAKALIEFSSHENPQKKVSCLLHLADIGSSLLPIRFSTQGPNTHQFHVQCGTQEEPPLALSEADRVIDIKVSYESPSGSQLLQASQTLSIAKGTSAALCFHFGGASPQLTSQFYEQFSSEKDEKKRLHALLAFVGASYFEKCGQAEEILSNLHKINHTTAMAFGLAKLSPDMSKGPFKGEEDLILPQVDMFWFHVPPLSPLGSTAWHQELQTALRQFQALSLVNQSSNEHQILREVFKDDYAVSTVKLLQLAHQQQQKKGLEGEGFLSLTSSSLEATEKTPEAAQSLYFSHLKDLNLRHIKTESSGQWNAINNLLGPENPLSSWAYAYITPGLTSNQDSSYSAAERGTLIFHPYTQYALISNNNLLFHGGLGSPLPSDYLTSFNQWQLVPTLSNSDTSRYTLQVTSPPITSSSPGTKQYSSDIRSEHKSLISYVSDPVDVVTGAFYIDDVDLVLPGPFALEIRRNYNSQNPLIGDLGIGWKLSLNPYLIKQDGKLYVAEADGTVIAYGYNRETSRWEVFPEDNSDLYNFNQKGVGGTANPFHAYIENDVLYGTDGSKRYFEEGLLKKWMDSKGNTFTFFYREDKLSRIESSNGDFCGLHYNHEGKISEIYAKDGRRISYGYNSQGELTKVTLPNTAVISYEYDNEHRIIRETKPHGKVLENIYKEGKVHEQRSPMGPRQQMILSAKFDYQDGLTTVTDAKDGKTTYKIFQKQIYKIIDPLGYETLQSWFIDENSWFDAETEQVLPWNQPGGAARSLKSTTDKRGLTTYYLYDSRGNPAEMGLKGEDLTGSGESLITKKFVYNGRDLCVQEEVFRQKTITTYDTAFPYLPKRIETYSDNTLISYVDLEYNSLGQIEKEDHCGSITQWKYDSRGFPRQKIQETGTDDPDVITTYSYNNQGQCVELRTADGIQESDYDIMGNTIQSLVVSPSGSLLSATYVGYNLNNAPIWKQTANSQNTLYIDYHASGLIKASRQFLCPTKAVAYTLYEYDSRGDLIQEVDPMGYTIDRDYDPLGNVKCERKEGHSTLFTYESGGLPETITSPSGAKTKRLYTTNGLLKEEIYPDGTKNSIVYDFFGRPILETKNNISWEIKYDDLHRRVIRTQLATKTSEIREFDARGNLIRFTDSAGYTSEKTYDGLNRVKTEISPSGQQTVWNYQGDTIICSLPNGEQQTQRYEGGCAVESEVTDAKGNLIASSSCHYDPETETQEVVQGEEVTTSWMNALGLPIKVQKGNITTTYEYDFCGNCIAVTDGDGRTTRQKFDSLRRMKQKELPDGSVIGYVYDPDSNLAEYHLPDGTIWKASYDGMGRKILEELQAGRQSSQRWEYTYENGYLKEAKDPMQRIHAYLYDSSGRLAQETVDGWHRTYTYDPRGPLATVEEVRGSTSSLLSSRAYGSNNQHSLVERFYDSDGRLSLESIYLNSSLIQQTKQIWEASSRSLQIGDHTRDFIYQNNRLAQVLTRNIDLVYNYDLSGSLKSKSTPLSTVLNDYNASGLPEHIRTNLPDGSYQESLEWYASGKLLSYSSPTQQKQFTYTLRGYLQAAGAETYDFDFGTSGIGVRTAAPGWIIPQNGLDAFGKILTEISDKSPLATTYNPMGQAITHNRRQLEWDPWGRLLKVSNGAFTWEASYDALGRRLQTRYTSGRSSTLTTTSLYDPEEEFQEIGVKYGDKTFWKIYGPNSCDAVTDQTETSVVLMHNALDQLAGVVSRQGTVYNKQFPSSYGPQSAAPSIPSDLLSYAQSLTWHSQAQDQTGLIWMGARYYEPKGGRFLSPDPVGHPICMDLYAYAGGDPVNYLDPDGRLWSPIYQPIISTVLNVWHDPRFQGGLKATTGFLEASAGAALAPTPFAPLGAVLLIHGADRFSSGVYTAMTGRQMTTGTSQLLQKMGMNPERADRWDDNINFFSTLGVGGLAYKFAREVAVFRLPPYSMPSINQANGQILFGQKSVSSFFSKEGTFKSKSLSEVVQGLRNGTIAPESIPIEIIVRNGQKITLNNRSLLTLRRAGMEPKIIIDKTGIKKYEDVLNEHLKGNLPSDVIKIRGGPPGTSLIGPLK